MAEFFATVLGAALVNNLVLMQFLGVSPLLAGSARLSTAAFLAIFSAPVMIGTIVVHYLLVQQVLQPLGLAYLELVSLVVIAALFTTLLARLVHRLFPRTSKQHRLLLFLTGANSAVLGAALQSAGLSMAMGSLIAWSVGSAGGFSALLLAFAALRERLDLADTPGPFRGLAIQMISAGLAAMALLGFAGIV